MTLSILTWLPSWYSCIGPWQSCGQIWVTGL